jgi:hypothetical protein
MKKLTFPGGTNVATQRASEQARLKGFKKPGAAPSAGSLTGRTRKGTTRAS